MKISKLFVTAMVTGLMVGGTAAIANKEKPKAEAAGDQNGCGGNNECASKNHKHPHKGAKGKAAKAEKEAPKAPAEATQE